MNRFAELLDRLAYEPGRNNKLRLLTSYFREVEDPDRGYALAALTGALSFKHAKPGLIRDLIADRTDPVLSHDGDRFTHGFRRFDAVKGRLHDVTHARHNQILCR